MHLTVAHSIRKISVNEEKIKVLCVDDDESILRGYQLNLRKDFDIHIAKSGEWNRYL